MQALQTVNKISFELLGYAETERPDLIVLGLPADKNLTGTSELESLTTSWLLLLVRY